MGIFRSWKAKNPEGKKEHFKDKTKLGWNIYNYKTIGKATKKFHIVHYVFKYKIMVPMLLLVDKFLHKYITSEIPDMHYNKDIQIFDTSFDEAIDLWCETYIATSRSEIKYADKKHIENYKKTSPSVKSLRIIKNIATTMALNDTAYREFLTCLLHKLAQNTLKEYGGHERYHFVYNSKSTFDFLYYVIGKDVKLGLDIRPARTTESFRADDMRIWLKWAMKEGLSEIIKVEKK
jgi:hypothetical protein